MKIAVDAMGGDYAPKEIVKGAVLAAKELQVGIVLVGDSDRINAELTKHHVNGLPISVVHASEVVGMSEPATIVRKKKDSSIVKSFDLVKSGEASAVVSAGNSGACMTAGFFSLGRVKGIERPAIATAVPTLKGSTVVVDMGANMDCKPMHLLQFAIMGDVYAKYVLQIPNPKIGLLSIGEEETKGDELTKATHKLLKQSNLNFIGNVEGKDIYKGTADVVVCDGFVGNVVLKTSEGLADAIMKMLKREIKSRPLAILGAYLAKGAFKALKNDLDYNKVGGAPVLGIDGPCIVSHGSANAKAIRYAIQRAKEAAESRLNVHILEELEENKEVKEYISE